MAYENLSTPEKVQEQLDTVQELRTNVEGPEDHEYLNEQEAELKKRLGEVSTGEVAPAGSTPRERLATVAREASQFADQTRSTVVVDARGNVMTSRDVAEQSANGATREDTLVR